MIAKEGCSGASGRLRPPQGHAVTWLSTRLGAANRPAFPGPLPVAAAATGITHLARLLQHTAGYCRPHCCQWAAPKMALVVVWHVVSKEGKSLGC